MKNKFVRFSLVALVIVLLIGMKFIQSFHNFAKQEKTMNSFSPYISDYLENQLTENSEASPYIVGKIVTIDLDQKAVDSWTYPKLPDDIRAITPNEVGTVVQIKWDREKVGDYRNTDTGETIGEAFRSKAFVSVIDWKNKMKIAEKVFWGTEPQEVVTREGDYESLQPIFQIVEYLTALPRRNTA